MTHFNLADSIDQPEDLIHLIKDLAANHSQHHPHLYEEDENLGDESFARLFEDPAY